ncbi:hypothetical protein [Calothrix sp. PCC 6303]|uniref:hypothetical protein n=1 Tax=Calothrix sp. PCC 6303 TaxID=1170562 RepID=UPI0002A012C4|nr:hypothetical protein [Calothrix sp. PCC 6303]AFY99294.1 hypothetical protein Cal6303_0187 [Calothrix sp. PCC 6303]
MIPIGKLGCVLSGEYEGWYVLVQDDPKNTGGYYIYISKSKSFNSPLSEGYDYWLQSEFDLPEFFKNWEVEWNFIHL